MGAVTVMLVAITVMPVVVTVMLVAVMPVTSFDHLNCWHACCKNTNITFVTSDFLTSIFFARVSILTTPRGVERTKVIDVTWSCVDDIRVSMTFVFRIQTIFFRMSKHTKSKKFNQCPLIQCGHIE